MVSLLLMGLNVIDLFCFKAVSKGNTSYQSAFKFLLKMFIH